MGASVLFLFCTSRHIVLTCVQMRTSIIEKYPVFYTSVIKRTRTGGVIEMSLYRGYPKPFFLPLVTIIPVDSTWIYDI